ncbi:uncharacterized protein LOC144090176 [Stigmatopora argus]
MLAAVLVLVLLQTEATPSDGVTVHQTPRDVIKSLGDDSVEEIECSLDVSFYDILWYKQDRLGVTVLLGKDTIFWKTYPEEDFLGKVDFSGDSRWRSSLIIRNLNLNDSAVYLCGTTTVLRIGPAVVTKRASFIVAWYQKPHLRRRRASFRGKKMPQKLPQNGGSVLLDQ